MERIRDCECLDLNGAPMSHPFPQSSEWKTLRAKVVIVFHTAGQSYTRAHHKYYTCTCSQQQVDFVGLTKEYVILEVNRVGVVKGGNRGQDMGVEVIKLYCMHV